MSDLDDAAGEWIHRYSVLLGVEPPTLEEIDELLGLAAIAAHASHRHAAPVSCWLAARSGLPLDEAVVIAKDLAGE
jgi:Domain of unknown function (DUF6457)